MSRQILPEGQENIVQQVQSQVNPSEATLSSSELNSLFHQWDGKSNLTVDFNLSNCIRDYLDQQKELARMKAELAELIYKPFIITDPNLNTFRRGKVYWHSEPHIEDVCFYIISGSPAVTLSDFKTIALSLGKLQLAYAPEDFTTKINVVPCLRSLGIKSEFSPLHANLWIDL